MKIRCSKKNVEYDIDEIHGNHCPACGDYISLEQILMYHTMQGEYSNNRQYEPENSFQKRIEALQGVVSELKKELLVYKEKEAKLEKELLILKAREAEKRRFEEDRTKRDKFRLDTVQTAAIVLTMFISLAALYISSAH